MYAMQTVHSWKKNPCLRLLKDTQNPDPAVPSCWPSLSSDTS